MFRLCSKVHRLLKGQLGQSGRVAEGRAGHVMLQTCSDAARKA